MEQLIEYFFYTYISEKSQFLHEILTKDPIDISLLMPRKKEAQQNEIQSKKLNPINLLKLQYWVCKGYLKISPSTMKLQISHSNVLLFGRQLKIRSFIEQHCSKVFLDIFNHFLAHQMLPFSYNKKTISHLLRQSKQNLNSQQCFQESLLQQKKIKKSSKKSKINITKTNLQNNKQKNKNQAQIKNIDYQFFLFQYSTKSDNNEQIIQRQNEKYLINIEEITQFLRAQFYVQQIKSHYLSAIEQIKFRNQSLITFDAYYIYKTLKLNQKQSAFIKDLIAKIRYQKIQQYLIKKFEQSSKLSKEEQEVQNQQQREQRLQSNDVLLVLNLIRKNPFMNEKELLQRSFLQRSKLQKCINNLMKEGLVSYYPDVPRATLFKSLSDDLLISRCTNEIAKTMHNLLLACSNVSLQRKDYVRLELAICQLDDFLIYMGY